ncbi:MAG TPA: hypothetical protein VGR84_12015 [Candidatus Acidoferrales bacterium]|nr:hypothetical protein [Candidatus Acidoferrales bacterium]
MDEKNWRTAATNAIRYWEPRRIVYNVVLATITVAYFVAYYPGSRAAISLDEGLIIFLLAVLANVAYSSAYIADVFFQLSDYHQLWQKYRWVLFVIGTVFAGIITRVFSIGFFDAASH